MSTAPITADPVSVPAPCTNLPVLLCAFASGDNWLGYVHVGLECIGLYGSALSSAVSTRRTSRRKCRRRLCGCSFNEETLEGVSHLSELRKPVSGSSGLHGIEDGELTGPVNGVENGSADGDVVGSDDVIDGRAEGWQFLGDDALGDGGGEEGQQR